MSIEIICSRCDKPYPDWPNPCPCGSGLPCCATHGDYTGDRCPACFALGTGTKFVAAATPVTIPAGTVLVSEFPFGACAFHGEFTGNGCPACATANGEVVDRLLDEHARLGAGQPTAPKLLPTVLGAPDAPKSREELEREMLDAERAEATAWMAYLATVGKRRAATERLVSHLRAPGSR